MISIEFLVTSLIVVLVPGTGVIYTVSTGLARGRAASVSAALGCTVGIVPHLAATAIFMVMTLAVFVVYGLVAHAFRRFVIASARVQRWLRAGFAASFAGLGLRLAVSER